MHCPQHHVPVDPVLGCIECVAEVKRLRKKAKSRVAKKRLLHRREHDPNYNWGGGRGTKREVPRAQSDDGAEVPAEGG